MRKRTYRQGWFWWVTWDDQVLRFPNHFVPGPLFRAMYGPFRRKRDAEMFLSVLVPMELRPRAPRGLAAP